MLAQRSVFSAVLQDSHIKEMLGQVDAIFQAATTVHSEALIQVVRLSGVLKLPQTNTQPL